MRREVAHNLMRLIAEGTEDEETDQMLRQDAISSYLALLDKPHLPDILIKIICWVGKRLSLEAMSSSCFTQPHECHRSSKKECPTSKCCFCGGVCIDVLPEYRYKHNYTTLDGLPKVQLRVNNLAEHIPDSKLYNIIYIHHASFL